MPAKHRVDITGIAEVDLEEIWILIAADSLENATRFVTELEAKIGTLEQMPNRRPSQRMRYSKPNTGILLLAITA